MREYELALIIDADLPEEERKKLLTSIEKTLEESGGKVPKKEEWGKKQFTYPISKKTSGYYLLWQIQANEHELPELDKKLRMKEGVIRFLLTKEEKSSPNRKAKRSRAKGEPSESEGKGGKNGRKVSK
jgi:small subunit ribosomal protein S6